MDRQTLVKTSLSVVLRIWSVIIRNNKHNLSYIFLHTGEHTEGASAISDQNDNISNFLPITVNEWIFLEF